MNQVLFDLFKPQKNRFFWEIERYPRFHILKPRGITVEEWGLILIWVNLQERCRLAPNAIEGINIRFESKSIQGGFWGIGKMSIRGPVNGYQLGSPLARISRRERCVLG